MLALHACPLDGPINDATAWTMTRVFTGQGPAYNQLMIGLAILTVMVLGSAAWLGRILYSWSRRIVQLEAALAGHEAPSTDLPLLPLTGERELDRLVNALAGTPWPVSLTRREAIQALTAGDIDFVLLDLRMPGGMDGIEVLKRIRERENAPPAVVLTAFATAENTIEAMRLGAFDHLTKPIGRDELGIADRRLGILRTRFLHPEEKHQSPGNPRAV